MKYLPTLLLLLTYSTVFCWDQQIEKIKECGLDFINNRVYIKTVDGDEYNYKWGSGEPDEKAKMFLSVFLTAKTTGSQVKVYYDSSVLYSPNSSNRWYLNQINIIE